MKVLRFPEKDRISTGQILAGPIPVLILHNGNKEMDVLAFCEDGQELMMIVNSFWDDFNSHPHVFVSVDMVPSDFFDMPHED